MVGELEVIQPSTLLHDGLGEEINEIRLMLSSSMSANYHTTPVNNLKIERRIDSHYLTCRIW